MRAAATGGMKFPRSVLFNYALIDTRFGLGGCMHIFLLVGIVRFEPNGIERNTRLFVSVIRVNEHACF